MHIEISKEMRKRIIVYSSSLILAILAYTLINRFDEVMGIAGRITSILFPFLLGFAIAFILNQPVMTFEEKVLGRTKLNGPSKRILSELVIFIIAIGLLILIVGMVVPGIAFPAACELQGAFHEIFVYFHNACAKLHK